MYERAITAMYLAKHPDEVDAFADFYWISTRRLMTPLRETFGYDILGEEKTREVEAKYQQVVQKYEIPECKTCGTKRTNHTWTKLDFPTMAKKRGH
jgi:hypothetical protein